MQLKDIAGIGEKTLSILEKHGITTIHGLLTHFPRTYRTYRSTDTQGAEVGEWVSLVGTLSRPVSHHTTHTTTQISTFQDGSGRLTLRWFNSPFIVRSVSPSDTYLVRGQLTIFGSTRQIVPNSSPNYPLRPTIYITIIPIYPSLESLNPEFTQNHLLHTRDRSTLSGSIT
jgi:ATP-dependent DNA helicase RecG